MNRLESELRRLYRLPSGATGEAALAGPQGETRALVLELARPADWAALSAVWWGVQVDLELPAPAIAVSGTDGLQLWFSLQEPVSAAHGAAFLSALCTRYLAGIAPARLRSMPSTAEPYRPAPPVPAPQAGTENWSAFVAPDLAPVFAETPWLDIAPSVDGQAHLLAGLQGIKPATWDAVMQRLAPLAAEEPRLRAGATAGDSAEADVDVDPRRFLQRTLNDETAPLALRVEAARTLLAHPADRDG